MKKYLLILTILPFLMISCEKTIEEQEVEIEKQVNSNQISTKSTWIDPTDGFDLTTDLTDVIDPNRWRVSLRVGLWDNKGPHPKGYCSSFGFCGMIAPPPNGDDEYSSIGRDIITYFTSTDIDNGYIDFFFTNNPGALEGVYSTFIVRDNNLIVGTEYQFVQGSYTIDAELGEFGAFRLPIVQN